MKVECKLAGIKHPLMMLMSIIKQ